MGGAKAPLDQVGCVVETAEQLGSIIDRSDASFVRLFALAVLRARPAQLYSQLEYIARFVHQDTLWSAESGVPFSVCLGLGLGLGLVRVRVRVS